MVTTMRKRGIAVQERASSADSSHSSESVRLKVAIWFRLRKYFDRALSEQNARKGVPDSTSRSVRQSTSADGSSLRQASKSGWETSPQASPATILDLNHALAASNVYNSSLLDTQVLYAVTGAKA